MNRPSRFKTVLSTEECFWFSSTCIQTNRTLQSTSRSITNPVGTFHENRAEFARGCYLSVMGVKGLWQILEAEGVLDACEVDFLSLKGNILAIDVSIWLYQFVKSVPSNKDAALSPLVIGGLFQRVCKLLHFGIKPIFVFDGTAPALKKENIASRQELRRKGDTDYSKLAKRILKNKLKLMALENISEAKDLVNKISDNAPKFSEVKAPPIDFLAILESPDGSEEEEGIQFDDEIYDYGININTSSLEFKKLPYDIQEQILLESRKRTIDSYQIAELSSEFNSPESPKKGDSALNFSKAQVDALIKRRKLMDELEVLRGNSTSKNSNDTKVISYGKIASSSEKKYIFAKNAQAGWTLSWTESNIENESEEVTSFKNAEKEKKEASISDIDDDNEFMKMMFGASQEDDHPIPTAKKEIIAPIEKGNHRIPALLSELSSTSDESDSEFDLNIPQKKSMPVLAQKVGITQISDTDFSTSIDEDILIQSPKLIHKDTIKLPDIILEGLIKQRSDDLFEPSAIKIADDRIDISNISSDSELDSEYETFIKEAAQTNLTEKSNEFKDLVDKLKDELREFNALSEASTLTSISPTKVLIDAFMEMLHHFRLPFVIAPFEAEAQCVAITGINGVISDDSDCLLFGAEAVYKGFFGGGSGKKIKRGISKITMAKIIEKTGLFKKDFIVLAHLLGCDYCPGIDGIGPKRALELVRQTKSEEPLEALQKIAELSERKDSKYYNWLKGKIPNNFIDPRVSQAFLNPIVTPLTVNDLKWGKIDHGSLERFMTVNAKWSKEKTCKFLLDIEKKNK
jgi:5'-3' exonuclease